MEWLLGALMPLALGAVALALGLGLWNVMRGSSPSRSQSLMRWRVILQFIAICIVMSLIYFSGR